MVADFTTTKVLSKSESDFKDIGALNIISNDRMSITDNLTCGDESIV